MTLAKMHEETHRSALSALADSEFCSSRKYHEQQWRANRDGAHIDILDFERAFVRQCRRLGIPAFAHCVMRTADEQAMLYVKGRTKVKPPMAAHVQGCAVDLIHGTKAWQLTREEWSLWGHIGADVARKLHIKVAWGGDWKFYDPAHFELENWRHIVQSGGG